MGMTNIYMGSLRYGPTGKRRKRHFANAAKAKPLQFKQTKVAKTQLDIMREQQAKQYKSIMEEAVANGTWTSLNANATAKKENPVYTGTLVKGIATMHKSNAVPVISQEEATDISRMRRG